MSRWAVAILALALAATATTVVLLLRSERSMPAPAALLRPGTKAIFTRVVDLDGDGTDEVVLAARATDAPPFGFPAQFLDIYAYRDDGWRRVFDGTGDAPPGAEAPDRMLDPAGAGFSSRLVDAVSVVDLAGDGEPELVVGILTAGAGPGPLELWVLSTRDGVLRTELYERTTRGGELAVHGNRLVFEFGLFRPRDPGCCPSRIERQVIGADPQTGEIGVLERTRRKVGP